jgi:hypothetical protein
MKQKNFTTTMLVDQESKTVFDAINSPTDWWSGEIEGSAKGLHHEFVYRYKDLHMSKQRVIEFVPEQKVVWAVTESLINYVEDKQEWTGTKIIFEISRHGQQTEIRFTHEGLHPQIECFDACSTTWSKIMQVSLLTFITTGKAKKLELA